VHTPEDDARKNDEGDIGSDVEGSDCVVEDGLDIMSTGESLEVARRSPGSHSVRCCPRDSVANIGRPGR
jgi:hypothetical protein